MLRQYFNCNERLEIFLTCFCNIMCYLGKIFSKYFNVILLLIQSNNIQRPHVFKSIKS